MRHGGPAQLTRIEYLAAEQACGEAIALAARRTTPTLYEIREYVEVGGLISYGTVFRDG